VLDNSKGANYKQAKNKECKKEREHPRIKYLNTKV
jgi:hypothetical protein